MAFLGISLALLPGLSYAQSLTIQGRVQDSAGNPVTGAATQFRVQILSPDANQCVLYDETQTVDLSQSNGLFSLNLNNGAGTVNAPATYGLERAISNLTGFAVSSAYCQSGSGTVSYIPAATDNRKVIIQFKDPGSMGGFETIPAMDLNPVPYAMDARSVGGYSASSLLRVIDGAALGTPASFTSAQFTELQRVIAGTSTNYMSSTSGSSTGARLPSVGGAPSAPTAGSIWYDSGTNTVKFYDGSSSQTLSTGSGSGTLTSVTGSARLSATTTGGAVALDLATITPTSPAGTFGSASAVPSITVDAYGRVTAVTTSAISALPTGTAGEFLKYSAGTWASSAVRMSDIKNATGAASLFGSTTCAASETFYWDSGTDQFKCQSIALGAPSATVANTYTKVTVAADGRVNGGSATLSNADITSLDWGKITTGKPTTITGFAADALRNAGGTPSLLTDTLTNRPTTPYAAGRIFIAYDTKEIYRDNGAGWDLLASATGSGGTLTNVTGSGGVTVTGSGATRAVSLDNTGKVAGTFYKVTTDADGRVSSGANALVDTDIPALNWSKITTGKPTTITGYAADGVVNALNTASFATGPTSSQPTGHTAGRVFIDTTLQKIQYDNGSAWIDVASNGGTGFSGSLSGEVTGTQSSTVVNNIGGINNATIVSRLGAVGTATDAPSALQLVKRDNNGDFAGRKITATETIIKGSAHNASLTADPTADYTLKLPDAKATVSGQVLSSDTNGILSWITPSSSSSIAVSGPITNTSGTIGINQANASQGGYLSNADWTTFNNKLANTLADAKIWIGIGTTPTPATPSGDVSMTNAGAFTVNKIKGTSVSTTPSATGQVLRYDGANYAPTLLSLADIKSNVSGSSTFTTTCSASQTLTWNSGTDTLTCQNVSLAAATQITGVLPIANGGTGANSVNAGLVFAGPTTGTAAPSFRALTAADLPGGANPWTEASGNVYRSTGNVGIGSTSPATALEINATNSGAVSNLLTLRNSATGTGAGTALLFGSSSAIRGAITELYDTDLQHKIQFGVGPANATPTMSITAGGVGIGTVTPALLLDIAATPSVATGIHDLFRTGDGTNGLRTGFVANGSAVTSSYIRADNGLPLALGTTATMGSGGAVTIANAGNVGIGSLSPITSLDLSQKTDALALPRGTSAQQPAATTAAGMIRWNSSTPGLEVSNGTGWVAIQTGASNSFANGTSGTAPNWTNTGAAYTLNIPMASTASVTAGLLSKTDYDAFTAKAPIASPSFTGTPLAPTAAVDTSSTQLATTAFVLGQAATATPLMDGTAAVGTSLRYARGDHVHPVDTSRAPASGSTSITTVGTISTGVWSASTIDVSRGGTGLTSGTANGVLYFSNASTIATTAGTNGQVLTANASGVPTWTAPSWVSGSGTTNYLTKFTGTGTIGASAVFENSGKVGIGTGTPNASAVLDVSSSTGGFLPPRLTTTQRDAVASPAAGLVIYNSTNNQHEYYNGTAWTTMGGMPNGAIAAFAATSCPSGWVEYTAARGRFLRGIDNGAGLDPDGTRTPGSVQADDLKSHAHTATAANAGSHAHTGTTDSAGTHAHSVNAYYPGNTSAIQINDYSTDGLLGTDNATSGFYSTARGTETAGAHSHSLSIAAAGDHTHTITVNANGGTETRAKNVAVLYCQYQGGNTGSTPPAIGALGGVNISAPSNGQNLVYNSGTGNWENQSPPTAPTGTNGVATLAASFNLTLANSIYQDTGLAVNLPAAGTYMLDANVRGVVNDASGGYIVARLYNATDSVAITNSDTIVVLAGSSVAAQATGSINTIVTVAAAKTIKLHGFRVCNGSCTASGIVSDGNGMTRLRYVKIAN